MSNYMPTWAEINLDNILHNYRSMKALTQDGTKVCAIIKANAYGHGSVSVAQHLEQNGCDYFGVATASEALELRNHGIRTPIMCLSYVEESMYESLIENRIDIPLFHYETAEKISAVAKRMGAFANIQVKLDTGMSRVGFVYEDKTVDEIEQISKLDNLVLQGIFTHFAMADTTERGMTDLQFERYKDIVDQLEARGIYFKINHVCNSAGIMAYPEYHLDMVRLGISLYGHYPSDEMDESVVELRPAMTLKTKLTNVKTIEPGAGVSYGHKYHAEQREKLGTMPIGYADGFTRMLSGNADVQIRGKMYSVVGRICMDQSMVKIDDAVQIGDEVVIFSPQKELSVERLAEKLGTINYELLCMVQRRIPRVYYVEGKAIKTVNYLLD
ncbi:MAG: alanine racemase [Peptostreptococcaceae bacterium]|nr:alanine racemase [Peptostreptococcaceae bacterium]